MILGLFLHETRMFSIDTDVFSISFVNDLLFAPDTSKNHSLDCQVVSKAAD